MIPRSRRAATKIAFIQGAPGHKQLCFAIVGPNLLNPDCRSHPGFDLGRQIAWSPDGTAILAYGRATGNAKTFGLIEFLSNLASSTHASDWGHGTLVTDISHPGVGVIAGAFSPNGKHVALVSNVGGRGFHVYLAPASDLASVNPIADRRTTVLSSLACQVSWRPDGLALATARGTSNCDANVPGEIDVFTLNNPDASTTIASNAEHPVWQPLSLGR